MVELIIRILDLWDSLFGTNQMTGAPQAPLVAPRKCKPEEIALILSPHPAHRQALLDTYQDYLSCRKEMCKERFMGESIERQTSETAFTGHTLESYNEIRARIEKQVSYEFNLFTHFWMDMNQGERHITLEKYRERIEKHDDRFDLEIFRDACEEVIARYREIIRIPVTKTGS